MSELRKANYDATFFITLTVVGWIDVFTRKAYADIIVDNLNYCQQNKGLQLFAWVIMPSHIHLIAGRDDGMLNELLGHFKSYTSKQILSRIENSKEESRKDWMLYLFKRFAKKNKQSSTYQFWQKTNHPVEVRTPAIVNQKLDYIHNNPVEAGLVTEASAYYYSSANALAPLKVLEV